MAPKIFKRLYAEIGVGALVAAPRDIKILCLRRLLRLIAYGGTTLILMLYLSSLNITDTKVGLFMTLTLLGDVGIGLLTTAFADRVGIRTTLALGSLLMSASGVVFALSSNYWVLLVASVLGVISPSANEVDPFKAVEESAVSHLSSLADRSSIFAWYILCSAAGTAGGTLFSGWLVQHLQENCAWTALDSYRIIFWVYAALGVVKFLLCLAMSSESEPLKKLGATTTPCSSDETRPLLRDDTDTQNHRNGQVKDNQKPGPDWNSCNPQQQRQDTTSKPKISLFPKISSESKAVVVKLCFLFALDAIASGLAPVSWMIAFFNRKFDLAEGPLGSALFVTSILSSALNLVASSISRHIGLIKAMVITHLPASITLALIPIPGSVVIAMTLLIFRMSIKDMDMVPRQAFIAAAVLPDERTAVMGIVNIVRTLAISIGPVITGALAGNGQFWIAFVIAGCLKVAYNVLIVAMFWNYSTQEERALVERDGYADIQGR